MGRRVKIQLDDDNSTKIKKQKKKKNKKDGEKHKKKKKHRKLAGTISEEAMDDPMVETTADVNEVEEGEIVLAGDNFEEESDTHPEQDDAGRMSNIPLGDLIKLKENLKQKVFDKAVFSSVSATSSKSIPISSGTTEKSKDDFAQQSQSDDKIISKRNKFKRENRRRPREECSHETASGRRRHNQIIFEDAKKTMKSTVRRDPRYDARCGEFDAHLFQQNYGFIKNLRDEEKKILKKLLRFAGNLPQKGQIKQAVRRIENQERSNAQIERHKEQLRLVRRENAERMKRGERPRFIPRGELRERALAAQYDELNKEGRLDAYMKKKEKKEAKKKNSKEAKWRPNEHRGAVDIQ